jgi:hypothetical protein
MLTSFKLVYSSKGNAATAATMFVTAFPDNEINMLTYTHNIHTYLHTYIHIHTYTHNIHTQVHTCIHTHIYIHT